MSNPISPIEYIKSRIGETLTLPAIGSWSACKHLLHEREAQALMTAFYTQRPLLAVGEPGVGKSQLARVAAVLLKRHFISQMIHPGAEYQDLLWGFDHTERLGRAQILAASGKSEEEASKTLDPDHFLTPGPLWWAINWVTAKKQVGGKTFGYKPDPRPVLPSSSDTEASVVDPEFDGSVLLIDEIDKASLDLPNGLLEALGNTGFSVPWLAEPITCAKPELKPLIVITSNNTRELPPAFLRRCVVLDMNLPDGQEALLDRLELVGAVRFPRVSQLLRKQVAKLIAKDRKAQEEPPFAGQAEYLDLLQALDTLEAEDQTPDQLEAWLKEMGEFVIDKTNRSHG